MSIIKSFSVGDGDMFYIDHISPYRLPPAVQFPDAYYYINLPSVNHMDYASFTLHFEDTTQRKWRVPGRAEFKSGTWELSWEKPQKI